ncbi:sugar/nucleoside kinase (ribokinase family) [Kineococcus xinjiangensis]|uniref:Sugar/nucleoside kinase (Ribokinase family) n=1 Tax=Kineococcus xinjiangensis TaxID=512762 RepID=A0A2S6IGZ9_9ACTN|nr:sugar/nucleoside kinase (ribokinase family) [Kineococcus xinjiangensis]
MALLGVVGDDDAGTSVLEQARRDGIDVSAVVRRPGATTLLVDVVETSPAQGGPVGRLLEDVPAAALLTAADVEAAAGALRGARCVLVQLQQPTEAVLAALRLAAEGGGLVVADGAPEDREVRAEVLRSATVLRADAHEAELLLGRELDGPEAVAAAAEELVGAGPRIVALGAGSDGDVVAWRDGDVRSELVPLADVEVADPTGGGDSFVAALAVALLRGRSPREAGRWASSAAACTVTRRGGRPGLSSGAVDGLVARRRGGWDRTRSGVGRRHRRARPRTRRAAGGSPTRRAADHFLLRRWWRVRRSSLRCFFLAMRLRRFLMTEPKGSSLTSTGRTCTGRRALQGRSPRPGGRPRRGGGHGVPGPGYRRPGTAAGAPVQAARRGVGRPGRRSGPPLDRECRQPSGGVDERLAEVLVDRVLGDAEGPADADRG